MTACYTIYQFCRPGVTQEVRCEDGDVAHEHPHAPAATEHTTTPAGRPAGSSG